MKILLLCLLLISTVVSLQQVRTHDMDDSWGKWCRSKGGIVCGWIGKDCCVGQCGVRWYGGESCIDKHN